MNKKETKAVTEALYQLGMAKGVIYAAEEAVIKPIDAIKSIDDSINEALRNLFFAVGKRHD